MPLDNHKLKQLYATLKKGGYKQDYNSFLKGFTGNENYANRKKVYDLLTENGAQIGRSYEDFMGKMQAKRSATATAKRKGARLTAAERLGMIRSAQAMVRQSSDILKNTGRRINAVKESAGLKTKPVKLGQNPNVVETKPKYNAMAGKTEKTYLTQDGAEYNNRALADAAQTEIDIQKDRLREAYQERDRINSLLEQRGKELDEETSGISWKDMPRGSGGAVHTFNTDTNRGRSTDTEYLQLLAAAKKNGETIRDLEAVRDYKEGAYLKNIGHAFKDTALDPSAWDYGFRDMLTANAAVRSKAGMAKTAREKEAEQLMLENTAKAEAAAAEADAKLGNDARFARIAGQSLPFAADIVAGNVVGLTGSIAKAGAKLGAKAAAKVAGEQLLARTARGFLKNTGIALGDIGAAAALTGTVQGAKTTADILDRYAGHAAYDPKTGNYRLEGGKSLGRSIYEGVANSTIENYTERLGEHINLGKLGSTLLPKIGLKRASDWFVKAGQNGFVKEVGKYLKAAGINGYPQEVIEEEVGIPLHAIFDGGAEMRDLIDPKQQMDIVGGMLFSVAGMGAGAMALEGGRSGARAVQYRRDTHNLDKAGRVASFRLTADKWEPLKEKIDNSANADFGSVMAGVLSDKDLSEQEKEAVWNYAQKLVVMRGHNAGQMAAEQDGGGDAQAEEADKEYQSGYDTTDADGMNGLKNRLELSRERLASALGVKPEQVDSTIGDPAAYADNMRKSGQTENLGAVLGYANARTAYNGMVQRVRDDIDSRVAESDMLVDSRADKADGMVRPATMKAKNPDGSDRTVYIISGRVAMFGDGSGVDKENSDGMVIVRDSQTGELSTTSPDAILSVGEAIDPEEEKAAAAEAIRQEYARAEADKIDGVLPFNPGDTYTASDGNGGQQQITIVGDAADEKGNPIAGSVTVQYADGSQAVMPRSDIQSMADAASRERAAQAAQEQAESGNEEQAQTTPRYSLNDAFTLNNNGVPVRGSVQAITDDGIEIRTEEPVEGKTVQVVPSEWLDERVQSVSDEDGNVVWQREDDAEGNIESQNIPENGNIEGGNIPEGIQSSDTNSQSAETTNTEYTLSDKVAGNGEHFYQREDGNIDLVEIPHEVFDKIGLYGCTVQAHAIDDKTRDCASWKRNWH